MSDSMGSSVAAVSYPVPHCSTFVILSWRSELSQCSSSCLISVLSKFSHPSRLELSIPRLSCHACDGIVCELPDREVAQIGG